MVVGEGEATMEELLPALAARGPHRLEGVAAIKGTQNFDEVADRVVLGKDWERATDRDFVIRGRHSRVYYRHADRWLRSAVEAHRLRETDPALASAKRAEAESARAEMRAVASAVDGEGSRA